MIRRILLPVDASEHSRTAAHYAADLARRHSATIYALGVVDVPGIERSSSTAGAGASHYARELRERRLDEARTTLNAFLKELRDHLQGEHHKVRVNTVGDAGPVHEVLARQALRSDIVVVAKEINFQFETQDKPGDTLFELLHITTRLVMVVPEERREIRRVLIAHDMSTTCSRVLYMMVHLRPFPGSDYLIVHADREGTYDREDFRDGVEYLSEHGIHAEVVVRNLVPSRAILEVAEERQVDAIVLGAYDAGKVRRMLFGSTAQKIIEQSKVPLIFGI
jgi:nucleotide-binding universal stress UspA family protein